MSALAKKVVFVKDNLVVDFVDGRTIIVPISWFPRLEHATHAQRDHYVLVGDGASINWPDISLDVTVKGLLFGTH